MYNDHAIKGFSLTHLSGSGCPILQDIPFMPATSPVNVSPASDPNAYASTFSHDREQATPGYYGVQLDSGIGVSLTATSRTGMGAFSHPTTTSATMLINTGGSVRGDTDAAAHIVGDDEVTGFAASDSFCGGYTVYFAAVFDHPFRSYGTWNGATITPGATDSAGGASGAYVTFDTTLTATVLAKVGISFVSVQNALANLQAEDTGWDFAGVQANARAAWNARLGQVEAQGGTPQQTTTFYTALYHALLHPNRLVAE